jgi:hypothetical protein
MKKNTFLAVIAVSLILASCKKESSTPTTTPTTPTTTVTPTGTNINSSPQFTGTVNGTNFSFINGSGYTSNVSSSKQLGGSSATANYAEYQSSIFDSPTSTKGIGIWKGTITFPLSSSTPDTASFDAFFPLTTCAYSLNYTNGIEVDWVDASGVEWTTSQGTGSQTGSKFTIIAKQVLTSFGTQNVKVMINFNCTLYNTSGGSMPLTNGVYIGYFEND